MDTINSNLIVYIYIYIYIYIYRNDQWNDHDYNLSKVPLAPRG